MDTFCISIGEMILFDPFVLSKAAMKPQPGSQRELFRGKTGKEKNNRGGEGED